MRQEVAVTFLSPTATTLFTLIRTQSFSREWVPSQDSARDPKMEIFYRSLTLMEPERITKTSPRGFLVKLFTFPLTLSSERADNHLIRG